MRQPLGKIYADCHPNKFHEANGLCKKCYNKQYLSDPAKKEKYNLLTRYGHIKRKYKITIDQWKEIYDLQNGKCPICQIKLAEFGAPTNHRTTAHVDHDHTTGRVRGLVCSPCNRTKIGTNTSATAERLLTYLMSSFDGREV